MKKKYRLVGRQRLWLAFALLGGGWGLVALSYGWASGWLLLLGLALMLAGLIQFILYVRE